MNEPRIKCELHNHPVVGWLVVVTCHGLTEDEARTLGHMLHDPMGKCLEMVVKDRMGPDAVLESSRPTQ